MNISLPKKAQVVSIGGGIMGCSVAYHLAKAEREKFQEDVNTILLILTLIFISAVGAYFSLHLSGRI